MIKIEEKRQWNFSVEIKQWKETFKDGHINYSTLGSLFSEEEPDIVRFEHKVASEAAIENAMFDVREYNRHKVVKDLIAAFFKES